MPKKSFRKPILILWIIFVFPVVSAFVFFLLVSNGTFGYMPSFKELENPKSLLATEVISSDNVVLGSFFRENRTNVEFDDLSPWTIKALIATEDIRFYEHSGIDVKALGRVFSGLLSGQSKGGGSTLTQQLSKMLFPREELDGKLEMAVRKFREWVIAVKIERKFTKEEIMTMYLNKFDFLNLAVGIRSASKVYFNTTPDSLTIEQAAMLVGMAKNPSLFNPLRRPEETKERRNVVLSQMLKYGYLSRQMYDSLKEIPLVLHYQKVDHKEGPAPYFREYLRLTMSVTKPVKSKYIDIQKYYEDSIEWETNPLYGWCNKNKKEDGSPYDLYSDGLKIYTTIDSKMQKYAEEALTTHLRDDLQPKFFQEKKGGKKAPFSWDVNEKQIEEIMTSSMKRTERYRMLKKDGESDENILKNFKEPVRMSVFSWKGDVDTTMSPWDSIRYYKFFLRASLMSMETQTGYVRAYVGGADYKHFQFDMVKLGKRQVGSTFKPFLYVLAMLEGFNPCYEVPNIPVTFDLPDGNTWTPKNSDRTKKDGQMVTLKWGLANSVNNISAWLMKRYNPFAVVNMAHKLGIKSKLDPVPAICLGTPDLYLAEMVGAYATFGNKGIYTQPVFVTRIEDKNGNTVATFKPNRSEAIDEETAFLMINLLEGVVQAGTSMRLRFKYNILGEVGAKTGTTQNQSDGWYMGITPLLTTGVWVGGEDRSVHFNSLQWGQGANMALPIWAIYMNKVYANKSLGYSQEDKFERPPKSAQIDMNCKKDGTEELPGKDFEIIEGIESDSLL
ncbi:MAG: penicillin-binding protein [Bacteroidetes bacterium HGW-Bacteroidetes-21]|nr:MAG: penicillin-binding protein [Bacteroidetes bacterium HGW-Bacteroidetes-21]